MATVVTPHSASQSAMAARSQELAPNRRTWPGPPAVAAGTRSAGTQTMCMSEWTSMPAAFGLSTGIAGGRTRGVRRPGFDGGRPGGDPGRARSVARFGRLMGSAPRRGTGRRAPAQDERGSGGNALSPTGSTPRRRPRRVANDGVAASRARLYDGHEAPVGSRPRTRAGTRGYHGPP